MMSPMSDLRVLIVADDPLVRAGLAALFAGRSGYVVVAQLGGESAILTALEVYRPDVVLWDLGWDPGRDLDQPPMAALREAGTALEKLAELRDAEMPMVVLLADSIYAPAAWSAGARCLLWRNVGTEKLLASLTAAAQGLVVLESALATPVAPVPALAPLLAYEPLTPREVEVLQLLAEGLPNKNIAMHLHISEHTVKFHVNALMSKLGAQNRTEAVVRATRLGILLL